MQVLSGVLFFRLVGETTKCCRGTVALSSLCARSFGLATLFLWWDRRLGGGWALPFGGCFICAHHSFYSLASFKVWLYVRYWVLLCMLHMGPIALLLGLLDGLAGLGRRGGTVADLLQASGAVLGAYLLE